MKLSVGLKSLGIQLLSFLFCSICLILLHRSFGLSVSPIAFLACSGALAALIALVLRFDWWWVPIQLIFPLLLYFAHQQNFPSQAYLALLLLCALIFWSTYRTQVPYYPSRASLAKPISDLLNEFNAPSVIDLGSGLGGLLFRLEKLNMDCRLVGVEIAPLPYWYSQCRRIYRRSNVKFLFGSYFKLNLGDFDVVFCYLSPAAMPALWDKVVREMKKGSLFLSYEFIIPGVPPSFILEMGDGGPPLYGWHI